MATIVSCRRWLGPALFGTALFGTALVGTACAGAGLLAAGAAIADSAGDPAAGDPAAGDPAAGDPAAGEASFRKLCTSCHSLAAGKNGIGPSLHGVYGRRAGAAPGFRYSEAMRALDVTWTRETLDPYLASPRQFLNGQRMVFLGIRDARERANVVRYLEAQR